MVRWHGFRQGETKPYVEGFMGWDPVEKKIVKHNVYMQRFLSKGEVKILEKNAVERHFVIRYPYGNVVPFRDRWTPKGVDTYSTPQNQDQNSVNLRR